MTLIELLVFLIGIGIAVGVGFPLYARFHTLWIAIPGGIGATILTFATCWKLIDTLYRLFPLRPPCKRGQCKSNDYHWDDEDFQRYLKNPKESKGTIYVCKCGDKYLRQKRFFYELLPDGKTKPYMMHPPCWRRWHFDTNPPRSEPDHKN